MPADSEPVAAGSLDCRHPVGVGRQEDNLMVAAFLPSKAEDDTVEVRYLKAARKTVLRVQAEGVHRVERRERQQARKTPQRHRRR